MKVNHIKKILNAKLGSKQISKIYKGRTKIFEYKSLPTIDKENVIIYNFYEKISSSIYLSKEYFPHVFNTTIDEYSEMISKVNIYNKDGSIKTFIYENESDIPKNYKLSDIQQIELVYDDYYDKLYFDDELRNSVYNINADIRKVRNCSYLFKDFIKLNKIPNLDISSATTVKGMFKGCISAKGKAEKNYYWNFRNDLTADKTQDCFTDCYYLSNYLEIPDTWRADTLNLKKDEYTTFILNSTGPRIDKIRIRNIISGENLEELIINGNKITDFPEDNVYDENYGMKKYMNIINIKGNFSISSDHKLDLFKIGNLVTELNYTFSDYGERLNIAIPIKIPSSVRYMKGTFNGSNVTINNKITIDGTNMIEMYHTFAYNNILINPEFINFNSNVILNGVFQYSNIEEISIPENITKIPWICYKCSSLKKINNFPNTINDGKYSFAECSSLETIPMEIKFSNIDINTPGDATHIFENCTSLTETPKIIINRIEGDNNRFNKSCAFSGCNSITRVTNIPIIGVSISELFCKCSSIIELPEVDKEYLTDEEYYEFLYENKYKNYRVFTLCISLKNTISFYCDGCYYNCKSLTSINKHHLELMKEGKECESCYYGCSNIIYPYPLEYLPSKWGGGGKVNESITEKNVITVKYKINNSDEEYLYTNYNSLRCSFNTFLANNLYYSYGDIYMNLSSLGEVYEFCITDSKYDLNNFNLYVDYYDKLILFDSDIKFNPNKIEFNSSINNTNFSIGCDIIIEPDINNNITIPKFVYCKSNYINHNLILNYNNELNLIIENTITDDKIKISDLLGRVVNANTLLIKNAKNLSIDINCDYIKCGYNVYDNVSLDALCETIELGAYSDKVAFNDHLGFCMNVGTIKIPLKNRNKLIINKPEFNRLISFDFELPFKDIDEIPEDLFVDDLYLNRIPDNLIEIINNGDSSSYYNQMFKGCKNMSLAVRFKIYVGKIENVETYKGIEPEGYIEMDSNSTLHLLYYEDEFIAMINNKFYNINGNFFIDLNGLTKIYIFNTDLSNNNFIIGGIEVSKNTNIEDNTYIKLYSAKNISLNISKSIEEKLFMIESSDDFIFNRRLEGYDWYKLNLGLFDNYENIIPPAYPNGYVNDCFVFTGDYKHEELPNLEWNDFFINFKDNEDNIFYNCSDHLLSKVPINFGGTNDSIDLPLGSNFIEFECKGEGIKLYSDHIDSLLLNENDITSSINQNNDSKDINSINFENNEEYNKIRIYYPSEYKEKNYNHYIKVYNTETNYSNIICGNIQISEISENSSLYIKNFKIGSNIKNIDFLFEKANNIIIENDILTDGPLTFNYSFMNKVNFYNGKAPKLKPPILDFAYTKYYDINKFYNSFYNNLSITDISDFCKNLNIEIEKEPKLFTKYGSSLYYNNAFGKCYNINIPYLYEELLLKDEYKNICNINSGSNTIIKTEDYFELKE